MPLKDLPARTGELAKSKDAEIIAISGDVRNTTAAGILTGLGFEHVCNLRSGMLDWIEAGLRTEGTTAALRPPSSR